MVSFKPRWLHFGQKIHRFSFVRWHCSTGLLVYLLSSSLICHNLLVFVSIILEEKMNLCIPLSLCVAWCKGPKKFKMVAPIKLRVFSFSNYCNRVAWLLSIDSQYRASAFVQILFAWFSDTITLRLTVSSFWLFSVESFPCSFHSWKARSRNTWHQGQYSWIGRPVQTHTKIICRETERATADLNIRMKSSWRGKSNGAG